MRTNYRTLGFFLETEMFHFLKKMFSFLNSFLHFQVMRKCPILNPLSMTMEGLLWSILVKFILNKKKSRPSILIYPQEKSRPYVLIFPQSAKGNSGERWVFYELAFYHDVIKENVNSFLFLVFPFFIKACFVPWITGSCWLFLADIFDVTGLHALPGSLTLLLLIVAKVKK